MLDERELSRPPAAGPPPAYPLFDGRDMAWSDYLLFAAIFVLVGFALGMVVEAYYLTPS